MHALIARNREEGLERKRRRIAAAAGLLALNVFSNRFDLFLNFNIFLHILA